MLAVIVAAAVFFWLVAGWVAISLADEKGYSKRVSMLLCLFVGPFALTYYLASPDADPCKSGKKHKWRKKWSRSKKCSVCGTTRTWPQRGGGSLGDPGG